ncbi:MAG TPA: type II toxin-antitoxin system HicA family toxin [Tepidisphaeraceae bacterium]|jgi:predicted RNA binding protein YcfA (HicA-like mRNA interferase family)|nr:type II toxin-antitoxin system HicA family toxin [Tepidisphaeraceae bacterium]
MSSRLPAVTAREVVAALKKAGFRAINQKGSHLYLWHDGRKLLTGVPIHPGDLGRGLVKRILKQAGLTEDEFRGYL